MVRLIKWVHRAETAEKNLKQKEDTENHLSKLMQFGLQSQGTTDVYIPGTVADV